MQKIQLVIFDCDGVLIDSEPLASRTLSEALQNAGVSLSPLDVYHHFTGKAETEIRRLCVEQFGLIDDEAVFNGWHQQLYTVFERELQPMPGMARLVESLPCLKAVASNSRRERLEASLGRTALWPHFSPHVYGADCVANPKPAPDLLLHCATMQKAEPASCIMIDDSPHGIKAAIAAGMLPVGFANDQDPRPGRIEVLKQAGAHAVVTGSDELADFLASVA